MSIGMQGKRLSQTVIGDVIMPMREFAPKSLVKMLKNEVSPDPFGNAWDDTLIKEFLHLYF